MRIKLEDGAVTIIKIFKSTKFKIQNSMESRGSKKKKERKKKKKEKIRNTYGLTVGHCKSKDGAVQLH